MAAAYCGRFLLLVFSLGLCSAELHEMEAESWCMVREDGKERSKSFPCEVILGPHQQAWEVSKTAEKPSKLQVAAKCYRINNSKHAAIEISWEYKISDLSLANLRLFEIVITDLSGKSSLATNNFGIVPNRTAPCMRGTSARYKFLYTGGTVDDPIIHLSSEYCISLQSFPLHTPDTNPQILEECVIIPENICNDSFIKPESTSNEPNRAKPLAKVISILSITGIVLCFLIVITITAIVISSKRKNQRRSSATTRRDINVLVLANDKGTTDGRLAQLTGQFAFNLRSHRRLKVRVNTSHAGLIGKIGISTWIKESFGWANKVIVISIPDHLRATTNHGKAFDEAISCATAGESLQGVDQHSKILVAHFEEEQQHSACPYMQRRHCRFHMYREWEKLLEAINSDSVQEQQPLL